MTMCEESEVLRQVVVKTCPWRRGRPQYLEFAGVESRTLLTLHVEQIGMKDTAQWTTLLGCKEHVDHVSTRTCTLIAKQASLRAEEAFSEPLEGKTVVFVITDKPLALCAHTMRERETDNELSVLYHSNLYICIYL